MGKVFIHILFTGDLLYRKNRLLPFVYLLTFYTSLHPSLVFILSLLRFIKVRDAQCSHFMSLSVN